LQRLLQEHALVFSEVNVGPLIDGLIVLDHIRDIANRSVISLNFLFLTISRRIMTLALEIIEFV